jgi:hypothetical protein
MSGAILENFQGWRVSGMRVEGSTFGERTRPKQIRRINQAVRGTSARRNRVIDYHPPLLERPHPALRVSTSRFSAVFDCRTSSSRVFSTARSTSSYERVVTFDVRARRLSSKLHIQSLVAQRMKNTIASGSAQEIPISWINPINWLWSVRSPLEPATTNHHAFTAAIAQKATR